MELKDSGKVIGGQREAFLRQNVYFAKDEQGAPIWQDTYVYAMLKDASAICG